MPFLSCFVLSILPVPSHLAPPFTLRLCHVVRTQASYFRQLYKDLAGYLGGFNGPNRGGLQLQYAAIWSSARQALALCSPLVCKMTNEKCLLK